MNDEIKKPEKIGVSQSDIDILKLMIKHYEERGGGYSQKEALKLAVRALKVCDDWEKFLPSEEEIIDKIINSKIVNYAKKLGRYMARLQHREYDDPEDNWLKDKSTELAKAISDRLRGKDER